MGSPTRPPLALSLAGFQFTYRNSYFDWRLLHGIDVDNVIRLTDVRAVEDALDTLQHGSFAADRDRLSPANCVQLFRLLQLAVEYLAHLRSAHALLLDCYNAAIAAAESWKAAARSYLDAGGSFVADSLAAGVLSRPGLDGVDGAKAALEAADRAYNAALDALETEDSRARHFRFRKHRTELSWSTLHAVDVDSLVSRVDVSALEGLLPNLTYGSILAEDEAQLTPHHFGQLVPLGQAALDYVLWQANATGALLEQAMSALQSACADIPLLTTATQELHGNISTLLLEAQATGMAITATSSLQQQQLQLQQQQLQQQQQQYMSGSHMMGASVGSGGLATMVTAADGLGGGPMGQGQGQGGHSVHGSLAGGLGSSLAGPWPSASVDLGQGQAYGGRPVTPGLIRATSPSLARLGSSGGAGSGSMANSVQILRLGGGPGLSRLGSAFTGIGTGTGAAGPGAGGAGLQTRTSGSLAAGALEELLMAAATAAAASPAGGGAAALAAGLPVVELHGRAAELSAKVGAIEDDLRMERSKTEEMRRILADIRERLSNQPYGPMGQPPPRPESVTFPAAGSRTPPSQGGAGTPFLNSPAAAAAAAAAAFGHGTSGGGSSITGFGSFNQLGGTGSPRGTAGGHGGSRGGSGTGEGYAMGVVSPAMPPKVRVFVDEDAIREQERQRALEVMSQQTERLKQQILREHQERRVATASALGLGAGAGMHPSGSAPSLARLQQEAGVSAPGSTRHSRAASRDSSRRSARTSAPNGTANRPRSGGLPSSAGGGGGGGAHHRRHGHHAHAPSMSDLSHYGSDGELSGGGGGGGAGLSHGGAYLSASNLAAVAAAAGGGGGGGSGGGSGSGSGADRRPHPQHRPPRPMSRLSLHQASPPGTPDPGGLGAGPGAGGGRPGEAGRAPRTSSGRGFSSDPRESTDDGLPLPPPGGDREPLAGYYGSAAAAAGGGYDSGAPSPTQPRPAGLGARTGAAFGSISLVGSAAEPFTSAAAAGAGADRFSGGRGGGRYDASGHGPTRANSQLSASGPMVGGYAR